ncbi:hypothetical protein DERF_004452 [Dermatophagoides farinae]|uniref:Uncharacterized protein n=2 Tax=Dermatophagoides farinae TaxID=6954 RepID=A0A922I1G9_DERFA|nr:hypothetical protein DERF_004452 [Dermatophagoides farinae]
MALSMDRIDVQLRREQFRLFQLYQQQCWIQNRPIKVDQLLSLINQCARPHLMRADFIPHDIFPYHFDRINYECLNGFVSPQWNICDQFVLDSMMKCWLQPKDMAIWFRLQLLYQWNRDSMATLVEQIMNDCTYLLEMINKKNMDENGNNEIVDKRNQTKSL